MPADDRGAVISLSARMLVIWGPDVPIRGLPYTRDMKPMAITVFRDTPSQSLVDTITANLRYNDPEFPITIIEAPSD